MQTTPTYGGLAAVLSPKNRWRIAEIEDFIHQAQWPPRVSSLGNDGFPQITSLWFHYLPRRFYCCTQRSAQACRHFRQNPHAGFELAVNEPPYRGITGTAVAKVQDDGAGALLENLTTRYLGGHNRSLKDWLMSRVATEVISELKPRRLTSWDFSRRMTAEN